MCTLHHSSSFFCNTAVFRNINAFCSVWAHYYQRGCSAALAKERLRASCCGSAAHGCPLAPAWFPSSRHKCRPDRHSCSRLSQQELSSSPNTTRLTGGGFTIKCENQEQIGCASLRGLMCLQPPRGWSACSLILTVHVHTDAVWSWNKGTDVTRQLHIKKKAKNKIMTDSDLVISVWLYVCMTVCHCTAQATYNMQPLPKKYSM